MKEPFKCLENPRYSCRIAPVLPPPLKNTLDLKLLMSIFALSFDSAISNGDRTLAENVLSSGVKPFAQGQSGRYLQQLYRIAENVVEICKVSPPRDSRAEGAILSAKVLSYKPLSTEDLDQLLARLADDAEFPQLHWLERVKALELADQLKQKEDRAPTIILQGWFYLEAIHIVGDYLLTISYPLTRQDGTLPFNVAVRPRITRDALECFSLSPYTPEITHVDSVFSDSALNLWWEAKYIGFGQIHMHCKAGELHCDAETMNHDFIRAVLAKVADGISVLDGNALLSADAR
jgi:hypothetical protein